MASRCRWAAAEPLDKAPPPKRGAAGPSACRRQSSASTSPLSVAATRKPAKCLPWPCTWEAVDLFVAHARQCQAGWPLAAGPGEHRHPVRVAEPPRNGRGRRSSPAVLEQADVLLLLDVVKRLRQRLQSWLRPGGVSRPHSPGADRRCPRGWRRRGPRVTPWPTLTPTRRPAPRARAANPDQRSRGRAPGDARSRRPVSAWTLALNAELDAIAAAAHAAAARR